MSKLYIITGPAGVGKYTTSIALAKRLKKSVLIEGDDIYHMVIGGYVSPWKKDNHLDLFWKNVISIISNSLSLGYDVVFNYIVHKKDLNMLKSVFKKYDIVFKVLVTNKEELLRRDGLRDIHSRMNERCIVLLNNFKKEYLNDEFVIDTTGKSVEDVIDIIGG